jgi:uncharacterized membrane protein YcaP (DUF421 family)
MDTFLTGVFGVENHLTLMQECSRAILIFFYGLLLLRLSGRRTFADWSALDVILSIVVGSALARAVTGSAPLPGTLAAAAVLTALHVLIASLVARNKWFSRVIEGGPIELGSKGHIDARTLSRNLISECDIHEALRAQGVEGASDTERIVLEASGAISVIKKRERR